MPGLDIEGHRCGPGDKLLLPQLVVACDSSPAANELGIADKADHALGHMDFLKEGYIACLW